ncbi:MAG TPA: hypothetical protein PKD85_09970 [Saprospiraceae bacterium]|nr:hypothetical protein [Saprospiraceae bacterium]
MEVLQQATITETKVKLLDGEFTPAQALDILNGLINQKINYHKIEKLQHWEQNHNINEKPYVNRIQELESDKKAINNFISEVMYEGKKLSINGVLTIKIVE